jgi:DNA repair photolyase
MTYKLEHNLKERKLIMKKTYLWNTSNGITKTPAFEEKGLATHAVNVGLKCDNNCTYCSTGAMLRTHCAFKALGVSPFGLGYAIVDKYKADRVASDAKKLRGSGLIELCTITDAYSPSARKYDLGRKCLQAILENSNYEVRILTKNAEVEQDFDLIKKYKDRVRVGISITATPDKSGIMQVLEENASPIKERMRVLRKAHKMGLRTYMMLCPLLPGIADSPKQIDEYIKFAESIGAEEIFCEAVNSRGKGLILTQDALEKHGFSKEAEAVKAIRKRDAWSQYTYDLIRNIQGSVKEYSDIRKLKFLLYPKNLQQEHMNKLKRNSRGIVWL